MTFRLWCLRRLAGAGLWMAAIPKLYLKGVAAGEMSEALAALVGPDAKGACRRTW